MTSNLTWSGICLLIGAGIFIFGVVIRNKLKASESWPKTSGTILESATEPGWAKMGGERMYVVRPKVIYEYRVDGKSYTSSQLALVEINTANAGLAHAKAGKFKVGQQVEVYYNPRKPSFATLQAGDPTGGKLPLGLTIVGCLVAMAGMIWLVLA